MNETATPPAAAVTEEAFLAELRILHDKIWPEDIPRNLHYPFGEIAMSEYLRRWARTAPDRDACIYYGRHITYAELDDLSDRCAAMLQAAGIGPGDAVALFMGNCPQFIIAFYAVLKIGGIHVPINPMFKEEELLYELNDTGATLVIADHGLVSLIRKVQQRSSVTRVFGTGIAEMIPDHPDIPVPDSVARAAGSSDAEDFLIAVADAGVPAPVEVDLDAVAALNYTGGTTGMPKGCVHTQRDMIYTCAKSCRTNAPLYEGDICANFYPLFWIAGENVGALFPIFCGATCVLLARWDAVSFMASVAHYRVKRTVMLVDNAVELMDHPRAGEFDLSSIETTGVSSFVKKLNTDYRARWRAQTGSTMAELSYGMTETHTCDSFTRGLQRDDFDLSLQPIMVGLPVAGTDFKICDFETHALLPLGAEGEICVRSPSILKSYWQRPEATAEAIVGGWLRTGDIGMIDELGLLHFLGRRKEMLKVKGMSVFPAEIEAMLGRHPSIVGSGVIGRPDEERGQVPVAFIRLHPEAGAGTTAEEIAAWCREAMAIFKVPEIRIVDQLPLTATGKVKKGELEKLLQEGQT